MRYIARRALALLIALLLALPVLASAEDGALPAGDAPAADAPAGTDAAEPAAPGDGTAEDAAERGTEAPEETIEENIAEADGAAAADDPEASDDPSDDPVDETFAPEPAEPEVAEAPELELAETAEARYDLALSERADGLAAADAPLTATLPGVTQVAGPVRDGGDGDALLDAYVQQMIDDSLGVSEPLPMFAASASLTGINGVVCEILKSMIAEVAEGTQSDTVFTIDQDALAAKGFNVGPWTASALGVSVLVSNKSITQEAMDAIAAMMTPDVNLVNRALLADCPSELYWYNKTAGMKMSTPSVTVSGEGVNGEYRLYYSTPFSITFTMPVSEAYRGSADYTVNADKVEVAKQALQTAAGIVQSHKTGSILERMVAYRDEICARVAYNGAALNDGVPYGDPWQMIYVFDDDENTNVVCEGYSKAFKYLFDLSGFSDACDCLLAIGTMNGGKHMWNIVRMEDGRNYLVDVTNCDTGAVGAPDKLFMQHNGAGSVNDGYTFRAGGMNITYQYDKSIRSIFSDAQLALSAYSYGVVPSRVSIRGGIANGTVSANPAEAFPGETIVLTITPNSGCALVEGSLKYSYNDGQARTVAVGTNHRFSMPAAPVTVDATFEPVASTPAATGGSASTPATTGGTGNSSSTPTAATPAATGGSSSTAATTDGTGSSSSTPTAATPADTGGSAPAPVAETPAAPAQETAVRTITATANVKAPAEVGSAYQIDTAGQAAKGFKSSNKKVATVNANGLVIPKKPGKVKITFKVGKKKRTVTLTVTDPTIPKSVALSASGPLAGKRGETVLLTATLPENTHSAIKWTSSNKKVATVNANGLVTFKKPGKATITATCKRGKKKARVKVRVSK